MCACLL